MNDVTNEASTATVAETETVAEVTVTDTAPETVEASEVVTTAPTSVATIGGRLGSRLTKDKSEAPTAVFKLMEDALGEGENAFKTDEFFDKAKGFFEKTGLLDAFLVSKGIETDGNISEWRPVLAAITTGKGPSAVELQHIGLNKLYNHGTKTQINLVGQRFYPVFIHGEEILKDETGMSVEDRHVVQYNSNQEAHTPGYDYQNIVYLVNDSLTEVFKITVKSAGHKFVTNLLRNYMFPNYKKGMVFNTATLTNWIQLDITMHTSKGGFINPYVKMIVTDKALTSDEVRFTNIVQRSQFDSFKKVMSRVKSEQEDAHATQDLINSNTTTDAAGDNFTQL